MWVEVFICGYIGVCLCVVVCVKVSLCMCICVFVSGCVCLCVLDRYYVYL